jgi:hypothetical protein
MSNLQILTYVVLAAGALAFLVACSENKLFDLVLGAILFISFIVFA